MCEGEVVDQWRAATLSHSQSATSRYGAGRAQPEPALLYGEHAFPARRIRRFDIRLYQRAVRHEYDTRRTRHLHRHHHVRCANARAARIESQLEQGLQPIVKWMLEHSPRFRQQCRTLSAAPRLRATVTISYGQPTGTSRARTAFRQTETGGLDAQIEIRSAANMSELLGHEFEHLIEQLDGVD